MNKNKQIGFTIIELIIAITIIGILSVLSVGIIPNSLAQGRDKERISDIDILQGKLEEYHSNVGGYPNTVINVFTRPDPEAVVDPRGQTITINSPAASFYDAMNTTSPNTTTPSEYTYTAYPTGCGVASPCTGYVLKGYVELPTAKLPNPYIKTGINNN